MSNTLVDLLISCKDNWEFITAISTPLVAIVTTWYLFLSSIQNAEQVIDEGLTTLLLNTSNSAVKAECDKMRAAVAKIVTPYDIMASILCMNTYEIYRSKEILNTTILLVEQHGPGHQMSGNANYLSPKLSVILSNTATARLGIIKHPILPWKNKKYVGFRLRSLQQ